VLGDSEETQPARLENISGRGARLRIPRPVLLSSAVRVDLDDSLLLGEVCYCAPEGDEYAVGLVIDQTLTGIRGVLALIRGVMGEDDSADRERPHSVSNGSEQRQQ